MNKSQFLQYVEATQRPLRRFLVALCCGDAQLADDIAQETYMRAYLSCDGFRDELKFSAWIHRIAYNTFLNYRRDCKVTISYDDVKDLTNAGAHYDPFRYQVLYQALEKLQSRERTAILLYYMEGYSVKEIASMIGASSDAVKQYLSRGRNHLRGLLSNEKRDGQTR